MEPFDKKSTRPTLIPGNHIFAYASMEHLEVGIGLKEFRMWPHIPTVKATPLPLYASGDSHTYQVIGFVPPEMDASIMQ